MESYNPHYGVFVRLLMKTSQGGSLRKIDIKKHINLDTKALNELIAHTSVKIKELGMELVGVTKNEIVSLDKAEKLCLRSINPISNTGISTDFKKMAIIFSIIQIERGRIFQTKLTSILKKSSLFKSDDIEGFLRYMRRKGYVVLDKDEDEVFVKHGWRFFVDFDGYDVYENIKLISEVDTV